MRSGQTTVIAPDDNLQADLDNEDVIDSAQTKGKVFAVNPAVSPLGVRAISSYL